MKAMPYVYWITHKETGQFYIGYREANRIPAERDFGIHYKTSSEVVEEIGFDEFVHHIVGEFDTGDEAYIHEQRLIKRNFDDPLCLNEHYIDVDVDGAGHFKPKKFHTESSKAKMRKPKTTKARENMAKAQRAAVTDETRARLAAQQRGKKASEEVRRKMSEAHQGKNKTEEQKRRISESCKGRTFENIVCPHCGKEGQSAAMVRWHFDNCKQK